MCLLAICCFIHIKGSNVCHGGKKNSQESVRVSHMPITLKHKKVVKAKGKGFAFTTTISLTFFFSSDLGILKGG